MRETGPQRKNTVCHVYTKLGHFVWILAELTKLMVSHHYLFLDYPDFSCVVPLKL